MEFQGRRAVAHGTLDWLQAALPERITRLRAEWDTPASLMPAVKKWIPFEPKELAVWPLVSVVVTGSRNRKRVDQGPNRVLYQADYALDVYLWVNHGSYSA